MVGILLASLSSLQRRWRLAMALSLLAGVVVFVYLTMQGYVTGLHKDYGELPAGNLAVHAANTNGETYGRRISRAVGDDLLALGASWVVPFINTVTGTSNREITLLRGLEPAAYARMESFQVLSGRALRQDDPLRTAMIGQILAKRRELDVGDNIELRGRPFNIVGVFETGAYPDNEAWISIAAAQELLGWGDDVSGFYIPDEGLVQPGDELPRGLVVSRQGETIYVSSLQYRELIQVLFIILRVLGVGVAFLLASLMLRLAWIQRYDLALLRTLGYSTGWLAVYVLTQSLAVILPGVAFGLLASQLLPLVVSLDVGVWTITPHFLPLDLLASLLVALLISIFGALLPILWLSRMNLAGLLRVE
jgi:ABC-type lipoprotein release transport system permease subunit